MPIRVNRNTLIFPLSLFPAAAALAQGAAGNPASVASTVYPVGGTGGGMIWISFVTLLLIGAAALLIAWLFHRNMQGAAPNSSIKILSVQTVGPRERIVIANVLGHIYVLGHTAGNINLIAELDPEEVAGLASTPMVRVDFAARLTELISKVKK